MHTDGACVCVGGGGGGGFTLPLPCAVTGGHDSTSPAVIHLL